MLETLTADSFRPHLGSTFALDVSPAVTLEAQLVEVRTTRAGELDGGVAPALLPFAAKCSGTGHNKFSMVRMFKLCSWQWYSPGRPMRPGSNQTSCKTAPAARG